MSPPLLLLCALSLAARAPDRPADEESEPEVEANLVDLTWDAVDAPVHGWLHQDSLHQILAAGRDYELFETNFVVTDAPDWCEAQQAYWDEIQGPAFDAYYDALAASSNMEPNACEDFVAFLGDLADLDNASGLHT